MSQFTDLTAAELAEDLDRCAGMSWRSTGTLSMLDEATFAYRSLFPDLHDVQQAFGTARFRHMHEETDENWDLAIEAAQALAAALRPLGDYRIARCKRRAGWGTCNLPFDSDGRCRMGDREDHHTD